MNNTLNFSKEFDFHFEVLENTSLEKANYSGGCSGDREVASSDQWEGFLEVNAGVVQY